MSVINFYVLYYFLRRYPLISTNIMRMEFENHIPVKSQYKAILK